jgi:hypothetical protein
MGHDKKKIGCAASWAWAPTLFKKIGAPVRKVTLIKGRQAKNDSD